MSDNVSDVLKKVAYTGIGLAALSVDMIGKAAETLAARGEEAVQKGKVMNEELRRKRAAAKANARDIADALEDTGKEIKLTAEAVTANLKEMSREEIDTIRAKLEEIRMNWTDNSDKGAES